MELAETQLKPFISRLWNLLSGPGVNWIKKLQAEPRRWRNCLCPLETFKASNVGRTKERKMAPRTRDWSNLKKKTILFWCDFGFSLKVWNKISKEMSENLRKTKVCSERLINTVVSPCCKNDALMLKLLATPCLVFIASIQLFLLLHTLCLYDPRWDDV